MAGHGERAALDAAGGKFPAETHVVLLSFGTNDALTPRRGRTYRASASLRAKIASMGPGSTSLSSAR